MIDHQPALLLDRQRSPGFKGLFFPFIIANKLSLFFLGFSTGKAGEACSPPEFLLPPKAHPKGETGRTGQCGQRRAERGHLFELLPCHPVVTAASVMKLVETTKPTAGRELERLGAAGVLAETTGNDRSFVHRRYLYRFRVGTELDGVSRTGRGC
jgi:hypothetical protein